MLDTAAWCNKKGCNMSAVVLERPVGRPKSSGPGLEGVKIEIPVLDRARAAYSYVKRKDKKGAGYTLARYLSECLRAERSLMTDYAEYIRSEARQLGKH